MMSGDGRGGQAVPAEAELLEAVQRAFSTVPRPEHFTQNPHHCCECAEHEATLRVTTPETIGLAEVGNPCWDPITFTTMEAFYYFMPGLARLALGRGQESYLEELISRLKWPPERIERMTAEQRAALRRLLEYLFNTRFDELEEWDREDLFDVIVALSDS